MPATTHDRVRQHQSDPAFVAQANDFYARLLERSAVDRTFRQKLLTDSRAALAEFGGRDPSSVSSNIVFVENTADATIVLPDFVGANTELSDQQLESVAGGTDLTSIVITAVVLYDAAVDYVRSKMPQVP
jgi:hypothetical protein